MHSFYYRYYRHLIGKISEHDLELLRNAEFQPWEEIDKRKAESPAAAEALNDIIRHKYHSEEAAFGYC